LYYRPQLVLVVRHCPQPHCTMLLSANGTILCYCLLFYCPQSYSICCVTVRNHTVLYYRPQIRKWRYSISVSAIGIVLCNRFQLVPYLSIIYFIYIFTIWTN
uniref:Ovule protein n=1 Tax=Brugia timori TaxID=42155 RepID=A0A0R3QFW6_9BILA